MELPIWPISSQIVEAERILLERTGVQPNCLRIPFNLYMDLVLEFRETVPEAMEIKRFGNLDVEVIYSNGDVFTVLNKTEQELC